MMRTVLCIITLAVTSMLGLHAANVSSGDLVSVTIKGVPVSEQQAINSEYLVSSSGYLYLPMIEKGIKVSGSSNSVVARRIEEAYKSAKIYVNPRITIITSKNKNAEDIKRNNFVTVAGHVKRPGPVPYTTGLTVYAAVAAAGDASTFGAMNRVEVMRKQEVIILDLKKSKDRNFKTKIGDTITVPQKNALGR